MSFKALRWAFHVSKGHTMSSSERLVLWYLANMHNEKQGKAWPSQKRIAEMTGLSKAKVNEVLSTLEGYSLLTRKVGLGKRNTQYFLPVTDVSAEDDESANNFTTWSTTETTKESVVQQVDTILLTKPHPINLESKEAHTFGGAPAQNTEKPMKLPKGMSVASIASAAKAEYAEVSDASILTLKRGPRGKYTPAAIAACWKRAHGKYVAGFTGELRIKDMGQLKQAYAKVGDVLPTLILTCMRDWNGFVQLVKQNTSTFSAPVKPEVGFFVRHADVAADFAIKLEAGSAAGVTSAQEHLTKLAKKHAAPVQSIAPPSTPSTTLSVADIEDAFEAADD